MIRTVLSRLFCLILTSHKIKGVVSIHLTFCLSQKLGHFGIYVFLLRVGPSIMCFKVYLALSFVGFVLAQGKSFIFDLIYVRCDGILGRHG